MNNNMNYWSGANNAQFPTQNQTMVAPNGSAPSAYSSLPGMSQVNWNQVNQMQANPNVAPNMNPPNMNQPTPDQLAMQQQYNDTYATNSMWSNIGAGVNAASNLWSGYVGYQNMKTAQDSLDFTKKAWETEYADTKADYERQVARQEARDVFFGGA